MSPRYRDDDNDSDLEERPRRRRSRDPRGFRCPFCKCPDPPAIKKRITAVGWVVMVLLLFMCFPLFWLGFFITEEVRVCSDCGCKLGGY